MSSYPIYKNMPLMADSMPLIPSWLPTAHCQTKPTKSTNAINPTTSAAQDFNLTHQSDNPTSKPNSMLTALISTASAPAPAPAYRTRMEALRKHLEMAKANGYRITLPTTLVHEVEPETSHTRQHEPSSDDKAPNKPSAAMSIIASSPTDTKQATTPIPFLEPRLAATTTKPLSTFPRASPSPPPTPSSAPSTTTQHHTPTHAQHHQPNQHRKPPFLSQDWVSVDEEDDLDDENEWVFVHRALRSGAKGGWLLV